MTRKRVLITGPIKSIDTWIEAARQAGWVPVGQKLLAIEQEKVDLAERVDGLPDWIAVTSSNALPALERAARALPELLQVSVVVVGPATSQGLRALGYKITGEPVEGAEALAADLATRAEPGARVLWPRGSISDELARILRAADFEVDDPVVYRTVPVALDSPLPTTDAVFFASPSAVHAWVGAEKAPGKAPFAVAIGDTTTHALEALEKGVFSAILPLPAPTTESLIECLRGQDTA